jgi:hypothetical protein
VRVRPEREVRAGEERARRLQEETRSASACSCSASVGSFIGFIACSSPALLAAHRRTVLSVPRPICRGMSKPAGDARCWACGPGDADRLERRHPLRRLARARRDGAVCACPVEGDLEGGLPLALTLVDRLRTQVYGRATQTRKEVRSIEFV